MTLQRLIYSVEYSSTLCKGSTVSTLLLFFAFSLGTDAVTNAFHLQPQVLRQCLERLIWLCELWKTKWRNIITGNNYHNTCLFFKTAAN